MHNYNIYYMYKSAEEQDDEAAADVIINKHT